MKILITGSTGALGRQFLRLLSNQYSLRDEIHLINRRDPLPNFINHSIDLTNSQQLEVIIESVKPDIIFHFAAIFQGNVEELINVNFHLSARILEKVKDLRLESRVILIGSAAEYGLASVEQPVFFSENSPLKPISSYGLSKALQSQLLPYFKNIGVDVVSARIFNLYGEGVSELLFDGAVRKKIKNFKNGVENIIEVGDLENIRDFISTYDAAKLIMKIADRGKSGEIYNVASGKAKSLKEHLKIVLEESGLNMEIIKIVNFSNRAAIGGSSRQGLSYSCADMTKTLSLINA